MRKLLLFLTAALLLSIEIKAQTATITASGFSFVPDEITVAPGTTIQFNIGNTHNAVEISQESWNQNGTTSNGGFNLPLGGGNVTLNDEGTYYYICVPHASFGMKGIINVQVPSSIADQGISADDLSFYPNPADDQISLNFSLEQPAEVMIRITDITGRLVISITESYIAGTHDRSLDISSLGSGKYLIIFSTESKLVTKPLVKM